jgi:RNA polymerase sigma factor (sigma-70 family)
VLRIAHLSDRKIIDYICNGGKKESKAIQQLLDDNRGKIRAYVLKNQGNDSDAEMVLVEGVTELIFNVRKDKFRGDSALGTYLYTICRGTWLRTLKKRQRYTEFGSEGSNEVVDDSTSPLAFFTQDELQEEVKFLLGRLGEACEKVLNMWSHSFSMKEISLKMGYKNPQIAMNKKNKCLTKLKEVVSANASLRQILSDYIN